MRTAVLLALVLAFPVFADEPKTPAPEPTAQVAFAESVKAAQKAMHDAKAFAVAAEAQWKLTGGKQDLSGTQTVRVVAGNPDRLRMELGTANEPVPHLLVTADGKRITRSFTGEKLYSVQDYTGSPLDELQADGVTIPALRSVGVDFLARPNMLAVLTAQMLNVEDLGTGEREGKKTHGYRVTLVAGPVVTVRFAAGDRPVPVEVSSALQVSVAEKKTYTRTLSVALTWDWTPNLTDATFTAQQPEGAKQVDDLSEAILAPDLGDVLGQPVPPIEFAGVDGKAVKVNELVGKSIVVLYAWATWAAPEGKNLPALNEFVKTYSDKGVTFVAVNVGDTAQAAKQFAAGAKYAGLVALDPKGAGLAQLRVSSIPAVVVIGKDGTLQSFHRGKPDTAAKVKADLDKLLSVESLVPKK